MFSMDLIWATLTTVFNITVSSCLQQAWLLYLSLLPLRHLSPSNISHKLYIAFDHIYLNSRNLRHWPRGPWIVAQYIWPVTISIVLNGIKGAPVTHVYGHTCHTGHVELGRQLLEVCSLYPSLWGSLKWRLNPGRHTLSTEPSFYPRTIML